MSILKKLILVLIPVITILFISCAHVIPDPQVVISEDAARPIGGSSQAIKTGNALYLAGQLGLEPGTEQLVPGGILAETQQALRNIDALLRRADYTSRDVVRVEVFLTNINDYQTVQMVFDNYFTSRPPAVNFVEVNRLPRGGMICILATASK